MAKPVRLEETSNPRLPSEYIISDANKIVIQIRDSINELSLSLLHVHSTNKCAN